MFEFTPGCPNDLRTDRKRRKDAASYVGDFEGAAARVVARLTGEYVEIQDDGHTYRMPDLRIVYRDGAVAYGEITLDIDQDYAAVGSEVLKRKYQVAAPALRRVWWVTLSGKARVGRLERLLPAILGRLEAAGEVFEIVTFDQGLDTHRNPDVRLLAEGGVVRLASRPVDLSETGLIHIGVEGIGGAVGLDWSCFGDYIAAFLSDDRRRDVREKLAATGADERHVFVGLSFTTPWPVYHAFDDHYRDLPSDPPRLPQEITHLWVWPYPLGRCLAWFPDRGWFNPQAHWATH